MTIAFAVFLVIFSIFLHELGHALYMWKYGIPIRTFSIGLPFPIKMRFSSKKIFNGATLQVTPFLLGAFVQPTDAGNEKMKELPYKKQADIYGAGPLANFLFSGVLYIVYLILMLEAGSYNVHPVWNKATLFITGTLVVLFLLRELFSRYLMIPLGMTMAGAIVWSIAKAPTESMVGPVGIAKIIGEATGLPEVISIAAFISLAIGLTNTLPLMPLDGGRIFNVLIGRYGGNSVQSFYQGSTAFLLFLLIGLAFFSDCVG